MKRSRRTLMNDIFLKGRRKSSIFLNGERNIIDERSFEDENTPYQKLPSLQSIPSKIIGSYEYASKQISDTKRNDVPISLAYVGMDSPSNDDLDRQITTFDECFGAQKNVPMESITRMKKLSRIRDDNSNSSRLQFNESKHTIIDMSLKKS